MRLTIKPYLLPFIVIMTVPTLLSCEKETAVTSKPDPRTGVDQPIEFKVQAAGAGTKADNITTANIDSFNLIATSTESGSEASYFTGGFTRGENDIFTSSSLSWPSSDPGGLQFYACKKSQDATGETFAWSDEQGSAVLNLQGEVLNRDIVCAHNSSPLFRKTNTLTFEHILSRIGTVTVIPETGASLSSVSLQIVDGKGTTLNYRYVLNDGEGHEDGTGWTKLSGISFNQSIVNKTESFSTSQSEVVDKSFIPGTHTLSATWTVTKGGVSDTFTGKTYSLDLKKGKIHDLNITLGSGQEEVKVDVTVSPWSETTETVPTDIIRLSQYTIESSGANLVSQKILAKTTGYGLTLQINNSIGGWENISVSSYNGSYTEPYVTAAPTGSAGEYEFTLNVPSAPTSTATASWPTDYKHNTARGSTSSPVDLSMEDVFGEPTANRNTANCYRIYAPGTYKIPLVFGNAITAGVANAGSYSGGPSAANSKTTFVDAYGNDIHTPYIVTMTTEAGHAASSADVVWTEIAGMVTDVALVNASSPTDAYIRFTVPADKINYGNALLALKDESGTIIWSWHIWSTASELYTAPLEMGTCSPAQTVLSEDIGAVPSNYYRQQSEEMEWTIKVIANGTDDAAAFITVRRAAIDRKTGFTTYSKATTYQWGRKDPFPVSNVSGFSISSSNTRYTVANAIQNPGLFIGGSSIYNWMDASEGHFINAWDMDNDADINTYPPADSKVVKTIYDPSPAGFCVPRANIFNGYATPTGVLVNVTYYKTLKSSTLNDTEILLPVNYYRALNGNLTTAFYGQTMTASIYDNYFAISRVSNTSSVSTERRVGGYTIRPAVIEP